jgi:tetratricopeptide (TPR) repeat protein
MQTKLLVPSLQLLCERGISILAWAATTCLLMATHAYGQAGCGATASQIGGVQEMQLESGVKAKLFVIHAGEISRIRVATLGNILPVEEFFGSGYEQRQPAHSFDCSWFEFAVIQLRRGFYVVSSLSSDGNHQREEDQYRNWLRTFKALKDGPGGPAGVSGLSTQPSPSDCVSARQDFSMTCPSRWEMTTTSEGSHFAQVNWSPRGDRNTALNVAWYSHCEPVSLKDGTLALYCFGDDFIQQMIKVFVPASSTEPDSQNTARTCFECRIQEHQASVGVLANDKKLILVDRYLSYQDSGLPVIYEARFLALGQNGLPFFKEKRTYAARFWLEFGKFGKVDLRYSGAHFGGEVYMMTLPKSSSCDNARKQHWELALSGPWCRPGEETFQWKSAEPVENLSAREQFDFYCAAIRFIGLHAEDKERNIANYIAKIGALLRELAPPPAIPEEARKAFIKGRTLAERADNRSDLIDAEDSFSDAIHYAPWWAEAYYNHARILEKQSRYDEAALELQRYLSFSVPDADAREARDRIYAIEAQKGILNRDREEYLRASAAKYVTGGATRVREDESPAAWKPAKPHVGIEKLYTYRRNPKYVDRYYRNVFRMPDGHLISVQLLADVSPDGSNKGDRVSVADLGADAVRSIELSFGEVNGRFEPRGGSVYKVSVSERSIDGVVSVTQTQSGAGFTIPLRDLYEARLENAGEFNNGTSASIGEKYFLIGYQGGVGVHLLFFRSDLNAADLLGLMPAYVVPLDSKDHPIGNSGYYVRWHGNSWSIGQ